MAAARHVTHVEVQQDRSLLITCDACDYSAVIPVERIGRPLGDCEVGMALLRVVYHVEHVENGVPKELLGASA